MNSPLVEAAERVIGWAEAAANGMAASANASHPAALLMVRSIRGDVAALRDALRETTSGNIADHADHDPLRAAIVRLVDSGEIEPLLYQRDPTYHALVAILLGYGVQSNKPSPRPREVAWQPLHGRLHRPEDSDHG